MAIKNKQELFEILIKNKDKIFEFGTKRLGLFGSYVRNDNNLNSDIDLIVEFEAGKKNYNNFIKLTYYIEELVKTKVELVTIESISPYIKQYIQKEVEYVNFTL